MYITDTFPLSLVRNKDNVSIYQEIFIFNNQQAESKHKRLITSLFYVPCFSFIKYLFYLNFRFRFCNQLSNRFLKSPNNLAFPLFATFHTGIKTSWHIVNLNFSCLNNFIEKFKMKSISHNINKLNDTAREKARNVHKKGKEIYAKWLKE